MTDEQNRAVVTMQAIDLAHFGEQGDLQHYEGIFADSALTYVVEQGSGWVLVWSYEPQWVRCFYAGRLPEVDVSPLDAGLDRMFDYMDEHRLPMLALCNERYSVPLTQRFCAKRGYDLTLTQMTAEPDPKHGHIFEAVCSKA